MEIIAHARNQVLRKALSNQYEDFEYIMMIDMDSLCQWDIEGILSSFRVSEPGLFHKKTPPSHQFL
jgi:hypothetical protein